MPIVLERRLVRFFHEARVSGRNKAVDILFSYLGFTFSRFLMWRDLDLDAANWPDQHLLLSYSNIRSLLGAAADCFLSASLFVGKDERIDPKIYLAGAVYVLDADSSQASAIEEGRLGSDFVIQDPPGTGKSQTIAHIIATGDQGCGARFFKKALRVFKKHYEWNRGLQQSQAQIPSQPVEQDASPSNPCPTHAYEVMGRVLRLHEDNVQVFERFPTRIGEWEANRLRGLRFACGASDIAESGRESRFPNQETWIAVAFSQNARSACITHGRAVGKAIPFDQACRIARDVAHAGGLLSRLHRPTVDRADETVFPSDRRSRRSGREAFRDQRVTTSRWDIEDVYPLAPLQQGMLFHAQLDRDAGDHIVQLSAELEPRVTPEIFRRAWEMLIARHCVLRTIFVTDASDQPLQIVVRHAELPWTELDWRGTGAGAAAWSNHLRDVLAAERRRGFVLTEPPLLRIVAIRLADDRWRIVLSYHHLLLDGWSLSQLLQELRQCCEALWRGTTPTLPTRPKYRNYIEWLGRQDRDQSDAFWRDELAGLDALPPLELGPLVPDRARSGHDHLAIRLSASAHDALIDLCQGISSIWASEMR